MASITRRKFSGRDGRRRGRGNGSGWFPAVLRAQASPSASLPAAADGPFAASRRTAAGANLRMTSSTQGRRHGPQGGGLFRDDHSSPRWARSAPRADENENVQFIVGGLAAHVQMAINEQTKKSNVLFISTSQSDEISAKPDTSPITFHEALNPTITSRVMGKWTCDNLGKKWWIIYADYAWGKQNNQVLQDTLKANGGTLLGSTPYPLGSAEFSAHLPKIQAAKPDVLMSVTPGADNIAFLKQVRSFGMDKR